MIGLGSTWGAIIEPPRHRKLVALVVAWREQAGVTQTELAGRLGWAQSVIAKIETGERRRDVVEDLALAEVLGDDAAAGITLIGRARAG